MTTSALLRHGVGHLRTIVTEIEEWLESRGFASVAQARGLMRHSHPDTEADTRTRLDYIRSLTVIADPMYARECQADSHGAWLRDTQRAFC